MNRTTYLALSIALLIGLIACIVWASFSGSVVTALQEMIATPWGVTTLIDLYIGLGFIAAWIVLLERNWRRSLPWLVLLPFLGNLVTLVYFVVRLARNRSVSVAFLGKTIESEQSTS